METKETVLDVEGMTCGSCVRHVRAALTELTGVRDVEVDLREGRVCVKHEAGAAPVGAMIDALREAGYPSKEAA